MKLTKGALGHVERLQHWLVTFQQTVTTQRFMPLSFQMGRRVAQYGARVFEAS
jgi:hypothetical protein